MKIKQLKCASFRGLTVAMLSSLLVGIVQLHAQSGGLGTVTGRVFSSATGQYVRNAEVAVEATNLVTYPQRVILRRPFAIRRPRGGRPTSSGRSRNQRPPPPYRFGSAPSMIRRIESSRSRAPSIAVRVCAN